jgi:CheY-like chemotaxis protein
MRVLIVEDDKVLGEGLVRYLQQTGYSVDLAMNGTFADALLAHEDYDIVVLDIGLPGLDGYEVLRRLRARGCPVAVLVLTARDAVDKRVRGLDLGADDYLVKPFALLELEAGCGRSCGGGKRADRVWASCPRPRCAPRVAGRRAAESDRARVGSPRVSGGTGGKDGKQGPDRGGDDAR